MLKAYLHTNIHYTIDTYRTGKVESYVLLQGPIVFHADSRHLTTHIYTSFDTFTCIQNNFISEVLGLSKGVVTCR